MPIRYVLAAVVDRRTGRSGEKSERKGLVISMSLQGIIRESSDFTYMPTRQSFVYVTLSSTRSPGIVGIGREMTP